jgi:hypothetical protein
MLKTCLLAGASALGLNLCAQTALAQVAPAAPETPAAATPWDAVIHGAPIIEIRPRYEEVDQTKTKKLTNAAEAYTVRTHLGWQTGSWNGFQALVEGANIAVVGPERFAVNVPGATTPPLNGAGKAKYPLINDPSVTELNRAQITWTPSKAFSATVGRQIINIDDQRFVGDVNWRQDQQTFDAVRGDLHLGQFRLFAAYLDRVNRTLGDYRDFRSDSYLINARYDLGKNHDLEAFEYLLDFGNSAVNSSETRGVRGSGKSKVGPVTLAYDAAYAHQSDYANAPKPFDLDFYAADLFVTYGVATLRLDREQLNGNGKQGFATPLATTHGFQGWADAFVSPGGNKSFVDGIVDSNISLAIRPPLKWGPFSKPEFLVRAYDFKDERFGSNLGHEWDLSASVNVADKVSVLLKYADFRRDAAVPLGAATPPPSRNKVWLMLDFKL